MARALEDAPARGLLGALGVFSARLSRFGVLAGRAASRALPLLAFALDYAWFLGTTGLLLTLPVLVEIQRETTVLVMQKQREAEMASVQEQAKHANGGVVEQMKGLGALIASSAAPAS